MGRAGDIAKRSLDALSSGLGLLVLSPVLIGVAVAVKLSSQGPVFYRQTRVGRHGRQFQLLKFRSMHVGADRSGRLTVGRDPRITPIGNFLRKSNLDELPQLVNVFKGDMSLVGPRPEVPEFVDMADPRWVETLSVRPGMTAPVTLEFRREAEILAKYPDPAKGYREEVLPRKLELNCAYVRTRSFWKDVGTIFQTFFDIVRGKSRSSG